MQVCEHYVVLPPDLAVFIGSFDRGTRPSLHPSVRCAAVLCFHPHHAFCLVGSDQTPELVVLTQPFFVAGFKCAGNPQHRVKINLCVCE